MIHCRVITILQLYLQHRSSQVIYKITFLQAKFGVENIPVFAQEVNMNTDWVTSGPKSQRLLPV